ncbi:MAG: hypothetical protein J2P53_18080 [Bradyrhizobiaceae bacterium]|nr:hypothetical protein [Bradyrhizobiaceae bacterium]
MVVTGDVFNAAPEAPHAIRISLGAVPNRAELARGPGMISAALNGAPAERVSDGVSDVFAGKRRIEGVTVQ